VSALEKVHRLDFHGLPVGQDGYRRLAQILSLAEDGFDRDVRTPFWNKRPRQEIIDQMRERIGPAPYPELARIDEEEAAKIGPLSIMYPFDRRRDDVEAYYHQTWDADEKAFDYAVSTVSKLVSPGSIRPLGIDSAYDTLHKSKNWGAPTWTSNAGVGPWYLRYAMGIVSLAQVYPKTLFWRGQQAGPNETKQRVVFGEFKGLTILEATLMYPLLNALKSQPGFAAWGTVFQVDMAITKLMRMARSLGVPLMSGDYSGFDSSIHRRMIDGVWGLFELWTVPEMSERIRLLREAFATGGLIIPWEVKYGRNGGVPSGSTFTNLFDSVANLVAGYYASYRCGVELRGFEVMGDDSVFVFYPSITADQLSDAVGELGLKMNPDKQYIHDGACHYLQMLHLSEHQVDGMYPGIRSPFRALSGLTGMERYHREEEWSEFHASARGIMQVNACQHDPRFPDLMRFYVFEADELVRSGVDPVEIFQRAGGAEGVLSALDKASFEYGISDPRGVDSFPAVQWIRRLVPH
jgi:hypothetical protein